MTRLMYAMSTADLVAQVSTSDGDYEPASTPLAMWSAFTGGTQQTSLQTLAAVGITTVTPAADGTFSFLGPDGYTGGLWADDGSGRPRRVVFPSNLADRTGGTGTVTAVNTVAPVSGNVTLAKADIGLGNVDNTADTAKPISTAQATVNTAKAPLASPTFTGTVTVPTPVASGAAATKAYVDAASAGGALDDLNNVTLTTPVTGEVVMLSDDNVTWTNQSIPAPLLPAHILTGAILNVGEAIPADMPSGSLIGFRTAVAGIDFVTIGQAGATGTISTGTGFSITLTSAVATGQNIIIAVSVDMPSTTPVTYTVTDTGTNTYSSSVDKEQGTFIQTNIIQARCTTAMSIGATITIKPSAALSFASAVAGKASGLQASSPKDQTAIGGGGAMTTFSVGPVTPTQANELAVCSVAFNSTSTTFVPGTGWTQSGTLQSSGGGTPHSTALMYRILPNTTSFSATGTFSQSKAAAIAAVTYFGA